MVFCLFANKEPVYVQCHSLPTQSFQSQGATDRPFAALSPVGREKLSTKRRDLRHVVMRHHSLSGAAICSLMFSKLIMLGFTSCHSIQSFDIRGAS